MFEYIRLYVILPNQVVGLWYLTVDYQRMFILGFLSPDLLHRDGMKSH